MAVKHAVRRTLVCLGLGVLLQRLVQLATFLCVGRALGVERLGLFAQGLASAGLLGVLAGAGVRNLVARAVAREPAATRHLVQAAVRMRLRTGLGLVTLATAYVFANTSQPWFWTLCLLQVLPAAFDQKSLLDAAGRARAEVLIETGAAVGQLLVVAWWLASGGQELATLAAIALGSRCIYALGAVRAIARLPKGMPRAERPPVFDHRFRVAVGQAAHEAMAIGDIWLVALAFGDAAAGLYAVAVRFASAALLPSTQLARLLLPHLLHAHADGDARRTFATALRATLLATLPMCAGGTVVAERLCAISGPEFGAAGPALTLLLLAGCLQHVGWQCSNALLAANADVVYARTMGWPSVLHAVLLFAAASSGLGHDAARQAALAAGCAMLAQSVYALVTLQATRPQRPAARRDRWLGVLAVTAATGVCAALPRTCCTGPLLLPLQLLAGGFAFGIGVWWVELRGRLAQVGDGLAKASGFRS